MNDARLNRPRVAKLLSSLEKIQRAREVLELGEVHRLHEGKWLAWEKDTLTVYEALIVARDEVELQLVRALRRGKGDCDDQKA